MPRAEQEGATAIRALLGPAKDVVDRLHHLERRPEVRPQRRMASSGFGLGRQVGVDVGAAERVDRLFGVPDQHQCLVLTVRPRGIDRVEDAVLDGVRVLELVDQRHRELGADALRQPAPVRLLQRSVELGEHVVESDLGAARFLLRQPVGDPVRGVTQDVGASIRQRRNAFRQCQHVGQRGMVDHRRHQPDLGHAGRRQTPARILGQWKFGDGTLRPGFHVAQPRGALGELAGRDLLCRNTGFQLLQQVVRPFEPWLLASGKRPLPRMVRTPKRRCRLLASA